MPTPPPTSAPATPATPSAGAIAGLVLSGLGSGGSSATHAIGVCGSTSAGFAVQLGFAPGGQPYILTIELFDHHGAGPYVIPPERVSVREAGTAGGAQIYPATTGTVTIDPGERTGTIDVSLAMPTGAARLSGQWAC